MTLTIGAIALSLMIAAPATRPAEADMAKAARLNTTGWKLFQQQKLPEALEKFDEAVKLDPGLANAWNGLGWSRFNTGHSLEAEKAFETCLKISPTMGGAVNGLGQIYLSRRQYDKAEKSLLDAAKLNAPAAWYGLAQVYLLQGEYEKAVPWAEKVVKAEPKDILGKKMLAAAKAEKLSPALRRQIEPPDPNAQSPESKRGWVFFQRGDYLRGIEAFKQAIKKNANDAHAHNGLGFCLLNSGKPAEAKPHFEISLKLIPEHVGAMNGLARCLKEGENDLDGAIKIWQKMIETSPGPHAGTSALAWAYLEKGEPAKAIPYFEQLLEANPNDTHAKAGLERARKALAQKSP